MSYGTYTAQQHGDEDLQISKMAWQNGQPTKTLLSVRRSYHRWNVREPSTNPHSGWKRVPESLESGWPHA